MFKLKQVSWSKWTEYFARNASNRMPMDWNEAYHLTDQEIRCIQKSVQQFQLGESSDGSHLISQARRYIANGGDQHYLLALQLFIQEEHRHSDYLKQFLTQHDLLLMQEHPVDSVFRILRHTFSFELSIMAMLTAEIIAVPYYKALHDVTGSPLLRQICRQVLRDEMQHLRFQTDTLNMLRSSVSPVSNALRQCGQRILLAGTVCLVWQQHHQVLRGGSLTFAKFWRINWMHFNHLFPKQTGFYAGVIH